MMTASNLYDLNSPMVTPYPQTAPPAKPAAAATQTRPYLQRLADSLLFNASVVLAVFSSVVYLLGTILDATPLGQVTGAQNMALWLTVIAGALALAGAMTAVLVATVARVRA